MQQEINTDDSPKSIWGMRFLIVAKSHLAPVVQKVDIAIQWIAQLVSLILIHWIVIYPLDNAIQFLNYWDQDISLGITYPAC